MRLYKTLFIIILLGILCACEKYVDFKFPESTPALVINSVITPDQNISVRISTTMPIAESSYIDISDGKFHNTIPNPTFVEDAVVSIYEDGKLLCTMTHDSAGYYISDKKPDVGATYKFVANSNVYGTYTAITKVPTLPEISNLYWKNNVDVNEEGEPIDKLYFKIIDKSTERKFYEITLRGQFVNDDQIEYWSLYFSSKKNTEQIFTQSNCLAFDERIMLITNDFFVDGSYNIEAYFRNYTGNPDITIKAVSESYYNYKQSIITQNYQEEGLFEAFANGESLSMIPAYIYTNIENGYGVFAGYTTMTNTVEQRQ